MDPARILMCGSTQTGRDSLPEGALQRTFRSTQTSATAPDTVTTADTAPQEHFTHCPRCGKPAPTPQKRVFSCEHCGFVFHFNVGAAYGGLILDDRKRLLVVRRAKEPGKGLLAIPGGFADPGETAEAGLQREVFEEVGLRVEVTDYIGSYPNPYSYRGSTYPVLDFFCRCRVLAPIDDHLTLQASEIAGYEWRTLESIKPEEIAFPSIRWAIQRCREKVFAE